MNRSKLSILLTVMLSLSGSGMAQGTSGTILGTVKDSSGAVLPGATISIKHLETGTTRSIKADTEGRYRAAGLVIGNYEVSAENSGFSTEVRSGINLTIGREALVDFVLNVGQVTERVNVVGEAPLVTTTSATMASLVSTEQIADLPLNGRSFVELASLQPAVVPNRTQNRYYHAGIGIKLSVAGARPELGSFLLDGLDISTNSGTAPTGVSGLFLGVDSVAEFQVLTNTYSAEYGVAGGGIITTATKSGTNTFHGSVFEYLRNNKLDAKNFFDRKDAPIPPFKRNQFGFSFGGPIRKDKTFFFGSWEGLRERLAVTRATLVPTVAARNGILPTGTVQVAPGVRPFLNVFPLPTPGGRDFGDGRAEHLFAKSQPTRDDNVVIKVDHNFKDTHSVFARYTVDDSSAILADYGTNLSQSLPNFGSVLQFRNTYVTIEDKIVFSPTVLNVLRVGYNRTRPLSGFKQFFKVTDDLVALKKQPVTDVDGQPFVAAIVVNQGLGGIGSLQVAPRNEILNLYHFADTVHLSRGAHSMKIGGEIRTLAFNSLLSAQGGGGGQFQFPNLQALLEARPNQLITLTPDSEITSYPRRALFALFAQDDWQVRAGLTLNLGLRYEPGTILTEKNGHISTLVDFLNTKSIADLKIGNPSQENRSFKNLAPRFGLAWDVFGDGKTSLRSGFGLSYALSPTMQDSRWLQAPPFFTGIQILNPSFPDPSGGQFTLPPLAWGQGNGRSPRGLLPTYVMSWSLEIQRQITPSTLFTVGYLGNRGVHLQGGFDMANRPYPVIRTDGSYFFPLSAPLPNPALASGTTTFQNNLSSSYQGLVLTVRRRISSGLQFQSSYTWAKSLDHDSGPAGLQYANNSHVPEWRDIGNNWGPSDYDLRNSFVNNVSYDLPFSLNGFRGYFTNGWSTNFILNLSTGFPVAIRNGFPRSRNGQTNFQYGERPNIKPGFTHDNIVQGGPDQYYRVDPFELQEAGTYGNLGRHVVTGPGFATLDFSLFKNFQIKEALRLQFRSEFFNILNHPNFQTPLSAIFADASGVPNRAAGLISETTSSSRQIQFGLKITF